ncbi:MAG: hypothetical protein J6U84_04225 [Bacteroidales bacterium]|nr:hypothetical protein [Bacteroidales bacterium]
MKKSLVKLFALFMAIFTLSSCEDMEQLAGEMDITIGKSTYHIPTAVFYSNGNNTFITGTNIKQSVALKVKDIAVGKKTLGLGNNVLSAIGNLDNISSMENTLVYIPSSGIEKDGMTALYGTITITKVTSTLIEGTFEGGGVKTSLLDDLSSLESLLDAGDVIEEFSGTFKAYGVTNE